MKHRGAGWSLTGADGHVSLCGHAHVHVHLHALGISSVYTSVLPNMICHVPCESTHSNLHF